jgi:hypothetical protein
MSCPTREQLAEFAAKDLDASAFAFVEEHLTTGCPECRREVAWLLELRRLAAPGALEDPPPWVVRRAATIPGDIRDGRLARFVGAVATLVFDTLRDPLPHGARAAGAAGRQMLFRVREYDVDVRVDAKGSALYRVSGQVLPGPERGLDEVTGVGVALVNENRVVAETLTNEIGEFAFDSLDAGTYALSIDVNEEILVVEGISLQST